ncbi:MAG: hypothetical protein AMS27_08200 [Bacteroides sp. SM23_62_1]|nr:MAG: hypothetical protein AMS27_08200 [Bacteroides sp. SM23_62_1]
MLKGYLSIILRKMLLMHVVDYLRYYLQRIRNYRKNREFRLKNPDVLLPPDYILYESFQIDYDSYYNQGLDSSRQMVDYFKKYRKLINLKILDWGCGPGRIIRHLPELTKSECEYYGTDYNKKTIEWCSRNIPNVKFSLNQLHPPLSYEDKFFDIIIAVSVFTHLSEVMHHAWFKELTRICKKNGIIYITTQGRSFRSKLTGMEIRLFDEGKLVTRGKVKLGHRTYCAFQPLEFMMQLFQGFELIEHIERASEGNYIPQDIWIIRKR